MIIINTEQIIFKFSQDAIRERKLRLYLLTGIFIPVIIIFSYVFASMKGNTNIKLMITLLAIVIPLFIFEMLFVSYLMFKKMKDTFLLFDETMLQRKSGTFCEEILYSRINKITVKRNHHAKILFIKIDFDNKTINLSGFENLEVVLSHLRSKISDESIIATTQYKFNWNNPIILVGIMIATVLIILLLIKLNIKAYKIFNLIVSSLMGTLLLLFRPISKNAGMRFKKFENVLSIILIIGSVFILIGQIFSK